MSNSEKFGKILEIDKLNNIILFMDTEKKRFWSLPTSLLIVLLVIINLVLFVGTLLLIIFLLTDAFKEIIMVPGWVPIVIFVFDIVAVVAIKFFSISHRAKILLKSVVLSISAGAIFAILCVWAVPF